MRIIYPIRYRRKLSLAQSNIRRCVLQNRHEIPKYTYAYRIDAAKLCTAVVQIMQQSLCLKTGVVRDVSIGGHTFRGMPFYERGGKSIESLLEAYREAFVEDKRVGAHTFAEIMRLLTKRGESKCGLSTYYIHFRYFGSVFRRMMNRVQELNFTSEGHSNFVKDTVANLIEEWGDIEMFVTWNYAHRHLNVEDSDVCHCCTFALAGTCTTHQHEPSTCSRCSNCVTFFETKVKLFLEKVRYLSSISDQEKKELTSMILSTPKYTYVITHYMAHQLRAKVQFAAIDKIKNHLKINPSKVLMVIDHKQKVLQMKYREGQVEYYGKKGMSVLGAMIVTWKTKGFEYKFIDCVFKGYTGQDNIQMAAALELLIGIVQEQDTNIKEIIIQSDNATCFASQELIPFIYHLNGESRESENPIMSKWIYTEAQTGRG